MALPRRFHGAGTFVATLLVVQIWLPWGLRASQVDLSMFNKTINMVTQEQLNLPSGDDAYHLSNIIEKVAGLIMMCKR